jgi:hypothetical protein
MAGRFGSKFKKRTSHTTSNIKTQSSPTVSKPPPPRRVSKPTPVRNTPRGSTLTSNVVNTFSHNPFTIQEATAQESYDTNIAADEGTKFQDVSKMSLYDKDDPTQIHPENEWNPLDPTTWFGSGTSPSTYNPVEASGELMDEKDLTPQFKDNTYEDLAPGTFGSHVPAYTAGTSSFIDGDASNKDPSNIKFTEGEEIPKQIPQGYKEAYVTDYLANDGQGEYRGQFYKPGNATADAHQEALDLQARTKFENSIQSNYFQNFTAGNMNDDMMKGLHNKIDKVKMSKDYKDELYSFYDTKRIDFNSKKTNKKLSKAEKIKAKIDKDPLSVSEKEYNQFSVFTGQNIKRPDYGEALGMGKTFTQEDYKDMFTPGIKKEDINKKNKPIWFDYQDLGY